MLALLRAAQMHNHDGAYLHAAVANAGWAGPCLARVEEKGSSAAAKLLGALPVQINIAAGGLQAIQRSAECNTGGSSVDCGQRAIVHLEHANSDLRACL
jgi:hypothetical protein